MSLTVDAGPPATPDDLRAAQERDRLLSTELARVRAAAAAWRNGLAGLLTALAGFSLIKGRSDIGQLAGTWAIGAGVALLVAFLTGAVGELLLIRAANGRPAIARIHRLLTRTAADHEEALAAASALRAGIALTLACSALLVTAVGLTWYGPPRIPALQVTTPAGTQCGSLLQLTQGKLIIDTATGTVILDQTQPSTIQPVAACPSP
jgi:hypothetical protein